MRACKSKNSEDKEEEEEEKEEDDDDEKRIMCGHQNKTQRKSILVLNSKSRTTQKGVMHLDHGRAFMAPKKTSFGFVFF